MKKKIYIRTYGCQMNERDSEAVASMLQARNYEIVHDENEADILLYNTCSVRDQAERKAIGKVGIMKRLKQEKPDIFIGIMGCMAQRLGDKLLAQLPHVDFVIGTDQIEKIPDIIDRELARRHKVSLTNIEPDSISALSGHLTENRVSEFIAVMRGCDMHCAYCIVPLVRGKEKSRPVYDILEEARSIASRGIKEIMLLGQNISAFGLDQTKPGRPEESPFADLLKGISEIDGIRRIRFTSPHPYFFNDKLINTIADLPKVCNGIHLPLQSGSDKILRAMNRRYNAEIYMEVINKLKSKVRDITFSTDVIVAFPGETEDDFNRTRALMNEVGFDNAYIFKYSPREGTPAAKLGDQIPQAVKEERNQILLADLASRAEKSNKLQIGRTVEILVEGVSKRNQEKWTGRTTNNKVVVFVPEPDLKPGELTNITIKRATSMTLFGE